MILEHKKYKKSTKEIDTHLLTDRIERIKIYKRKYFTGRQKPYQTTPITIDKYLKICLISS
jgi:hypothetical protein